MPNHSASNAADSGRSRIKVKGSQLPRLEYRRTVVQVVFSRMGAAGLIRHLALIAKDFCITKHEAVLFLPACYLEKNTTLPLSEFYTVYKIAIMIRGLTV